jgi:hypothetical protein
MGSRECELILEPQSIRILWRPDAARFWSEGWAAEEKKGQLRTELPNVPVTAPGVDRLTHRGPHETV